ncbi:hypothetical protein G7Y89_g11531 [Cudoniella acicularis]|uniref:HET-domain-containing protein n=1 Tax=Cudoniella acicularis TaxID=354080 RepID=A0A8H4RAQ2_9HELO|nr:hypothetical protein G7Y89_g11531 [Cudoniella acicularis]
MRLLKLVGPNEFSLVQVPTHNTLPYAILSHTWIHGQEVTYQDLISGDGKSKTGYDKIKFCGEQATKDGFLYFWVDTCCIDKSDPTELGTTINSMFRWYRNAKKCYVYLADVSTPNYEADIQTDQSTWEAAFRKSKWFTRGWTLQELIAPESVEFFSQDGKKLGDKKSLETSIHETTRIPIKALQGNPFSDFSIAERKEWAAQRQTTEEEDMVYCLIGLCEVSMPLLYGEGKEAALKRLGMAVKEFSQDSREPKDRRDNKVPFIVPFGRNHRFTGRESQLAQLEENLLPQDRTAKVAITGLGGVGKTQLLLELVYRAREKYKNCSVIWIPATNKESLQQAYLDVAQQLGIPGWEEEKANVNRLVQDHLSNESAGQWLLVFDNADDINMWIGRSTSERESSRLIDYLPRSEHGCIFFTTRDRKTAVKLAHNNVVEVPEMDENLATQLLQKCLVDPDLVNNQADTKALLRELTYLPLAIVQAAAYINENRIAFSDYLALLTEQEEDVIDLLSEEFEDDGRNHNVKNPVATTWLISFEQIQHRDPLAADYLSFMACIDSKDIPQSLLPVGPSRKKAIDAIGTLDAYSFIIKRSADLAFDLHRLVHLATRNWLRKQELVAQWTERAITRLEEVFPDHDHQNRSVWRIYLPHIQYTLISNVINADAPNRIKLAWRFGMCLYSDGRYNEAEGQFIEVFKTKKRVLGQEHPDTLTSMANLASTYRNQGRWKEAEDLDVLVMETRKRVLGQGHPSTLTSIANLASTFWNQGRWKEAEDLDVLVMETSSKVLGQEHPDTLTSMNNLAFIWKSQEWLKILWSNEVTFLVGGRFAKVRVTRNTKERHCLNCIQHQFYREHTTPVSAWGAIGYGYKSPLVFIKGTGKSSALKQIDYLAQVLEPHIRPILEAFAEVTHRLRPSAEPLFMEEGNSAHGYKSSYNYCQRFRTKYGIILMPHLSSSPDINPIEKCWRYVKQTLYRRLRQPTTEAEMEITVREIWDAIPQEWINKLILKQEHWVAVLLSVKLLNLARKYRGRHSCSSKKNEKMAMVVNTRTGKQAEISRVAQPEVAEATAGKNADTDAGIDATQTAAGDGVGAAAKQEEKEEKEEREESEEELPPSLFSTALTPTTPTDPNQDPDPIRALTLLEIALTPGRTLTTTSPGPILHVPTASEMRHRIGKSREEDKKGWW